MWHIEWKRRTARWEIGNVLMFGSDEERLAQRSADGLPAFPLDVRSAPESGHVRCKGPRPLRANDRHHIEL